MLFLILPFRIVDGALELTLNGKCAHTSCVEDYQEMLQTYKVSKTVACAEDAVQFIKHKNSILPNGLLTQSNSDEGNLFVTMNATLSRKFFFLVDGDETKLRPMILKTLPIW
jgi:RNA polymerase sigma-54 factor